MVQVRLDNITKSYSKQILAVDNINLSIADHEFIVILGPSGCGKTTTLRVVAGLETADSGTITIGDTIVNDIPPKDRDIAMVFENYALYPHMTVYQNLAFGLQLQKTPKDQIKQRIIEAAELLGIESLLQRKPKALSGGQRQRVALGRAIVRKPKVFLFDEPLSNLDTRLRCNMRVELKSLHHKLNATSIYVTHDQAEAMTLADRICVMVDGRIQQISDPMTVYHRPSNRFVAGFLGTPSMNFFQGRITSKNGRLVFALDDSEIHIPDHLISATEPYTGQSMVMGIRPENVRLSFGNETTDTIFKARIIVMESKGDRVDAHLDSSTGSRFVATFDPDVVLKPDESVAVSMLNDKIHFFEPGAMGRNILSD